MTIWDAARPSGKMRIPSPPFKIPPPKVPEPSSSRMIHMITSAMGTGAVDYVVKGCEEERLLEHIRRASEGRAELDPKIQNTVMQEYARLRRSERSLIFFINNVAHLTPAEHELVKLLLQDKKVAEIARLRCVEVVTIKTQIKGLLGKFGCSRTKEIVKMIRQMNLEHLFQ